MYLADIGQYMVLTKKQQMEPSDTEKGVNNFVINRFDNILYLLFPVESAKKSAFFRASVLLSGVGLHGVDNLIRTSLTEDGTVAITIQGIASASTSTMTALDKSMLTINLLDFCQLCELN